MGNGLFNANSSASARVSLPILHFRFVHGKRSHKPRAKAHTHTVGRLIAPTLRQRCLATFHYYCSALFSLTQIPPFFLDLALYLFLLFFFHRAKRALRRSLLKCGNEREENELHCVCRQVVFGHVFFSSRLFQMPTLS